MNVPLRLTTLISGGGRTVCNLQEAIRRGDVHAKITQVIASREDCPGIERARALGLDVQVPDATAYDDDLVRLITSSQADIICLCGYLRMLRLQPEWRGRVINIHPALLPRHGGQGMYGERVHQSVLSAGDRISGCTVHFVDEEYDHGPILLQRSCPVCQDDTPSTLADRVFQEECLCLPEAVQLLAEHRVKLVDGDVEILPPLPISPSDV
ncbi:MAG: phosphoribosylglycinamide formyltransferase [Planctomycetota bacterium]|nr:phosphoribosylglycinamide formyltransferase [Planctomycetota bacterium]